MSDEPGWEDEIVYELVEPWTWGQRVTALFMPGIALAILVFYLGTLAGHDRGFKDGRLQGHIDHMIEDTLRSSRPAPAPTVDPQPAPAPTQEPAPDGPLTACPHLECRTLPPGPEDGWLVSSVSKI